jgi:serine protease Do
LDKQVTILDRMEVFKDDPRFARFRPEMENPDAKASVNTARFGIGIKPLAEDWKKQNAFSEPSGVQVTVVEEGSFAEEIGVQEKDIVVTINRKPVNSIDDIRNIQTTLKTGDPVAFQIARPVRTLTGAPRGPSGWATVYLGGRVPRP